MAEEILLDYLINQPNIDIAREETDLKVLMKINASDAIRDPSKTTLATRTNMALVLDVSSSMKNREINALAAAAKDAVSKLRPGDFVSVIAFQSVVFEVVESVEIIDKSTVEEIHKKINVIDQFQGGGTDLEYALTKAEHLLATNSDGFVRKIIAFTDGKITGIEDDCLKRAFEISERGIGIDALGFGKEFDYKFMQRLVSYSNGFTTYVEKPEDIQAIFQNRVSAIKNVVATDVTLDLHFTPQLRANRGYRYSPEISYMGKMKLPGNERMISIPIGTLEKDKEYAYLLTCVVPTRETGKVRIFKAQLHYSIPSLGIENASSTQSIVVNYTHKAQSINEINGEVERAFDEVEIGRLIEELDGSMNKKDHAHVAMLFDILSERHRELGDEDMAAHYLTLKSSYASAGSISQEEMNYTRHKSTQKKESGIKLVDASSLI